MLILSITRLQGCPCLCQLAYKPTSQHGCKRAWLMLLHANMGRRLFLALSTSKNHDVYCISTAHDEKPMIQSEGSSTCACPASHAPSTASARLYLTAVCRLFLCTRLEVGRFWLGHVGRFPMRPDAVGFEAVPRPKPGVAQSATPFSGTKECSFSSKTRGARTQTDAASSSPWSYCDMPHRKFSRSIRSLVRLASSHAGQANKTMWRAAIQKAEKKTI